MRSHSSVQHALWLLREGLQRVLEEAEDQELTHEQVSALCILLEEALGHGACPLCDEASGTINMPRPLKFSGYCQEHHKHYEMVVALMWFVEALHEETRLVMKCKDCKWFADGKCYLNGWAEGASHPCRFWVYYKDGPRVRSNKRSTRRPLVVWEE